MFLSDANKLDPVRHPCAPPVTHLSASPPSWSEGFQISPHTCSFTLLHFCAAAAAADVSASQHPSSSTPEFLIWLSTDRVRKKKENCRKKYQKNLAGLRPPSSLIRDMVFPQTFLPCKQVYEGAEDQGQGFEWQKNEADLLKTWNPHGDLPPFALSAVNEI